MIYFNEQMSNDSENKRVWDFQLQSIDVDEANKIREFCRSGIDKELDCWYKFPKVGTDFYRITVDSKEENPSSKWEDRIWTYFLVVSTWRITSISFSINKQNKKSFKIRLCEVCNGKTVNRQINYDEEQFMQSCFASKEDAEKELVNVLAGRKNFILNWSSVPEKYKW